MGLSIVNTSADEPAVDEMVTVGAAAPLDKAPSARQLNDDEESHWLVEQARWPKEMDGE
jgi:hypothetical protein